MAYVPPGVTDEYLRVWRLILSGDTLPGQASSSSEIFSSEVPTGHGTGLMTYGAGLRIVFTVQQATSQTPNSAEITIYNLADDFASRVVKENNYVILQAGYEWGQAGTIFTGTIRQYKRGHDNATDSYLKIYAADGDAPYTKAWTNTTIKSQTPAKDHLATLEKDYYQYGVGRGYVQENALVKAPNIRDEVYYGATADRLRDFSRQNSAIWWVLNQRFNFAKPQSYDPGVIVDLNSQTGLIGFPEMTQDGITVKALINPAIRLRQRIKLNNAYINSYFLPGQSEAGTFQEHNPSFQGALLGYSNIAYYAKTNADGIYSPWVIQYEGDSRGGPWYMNMICFTVDSSADLFNSLVGAIDYGFR